MHDVEGVPDSASCIMKGRLKNKDTQAPNTTQDGAGSPPRVARARGQWFARGEQAQASTMVRGLSPSSAPGLDVKQVQFRGFGKCTRCKLQRCLPGRSLQDRQ